MAGWGQWKPGCSVLAVALLFLTPLFRFQVEQEGRPQAKEQEVDKSGWEKRPFRAGTADCQNQGSAAPLCPESEGSGKHNTNQSPRFWREQSLDYIPPPEGQACTRAREHTCTPSPNACLVLWDVPPIPLMPSVSPSLSAREEAAGGLLWKAQRMVRTLPRASPREATCRKQTSREQPPLPADSAPRPLQASVGKHGYMEGSPCSNTVRHSGPGLTCPSQRLPEPPPMSSALSIVPPCLFPSFI